MYIISVAKLVNFPKPNENGLLHHICGEHNSEIIQLRPHDVD